MWVVVAVAVVASLLLTNLLVGCLKQRQQRSLAAKCAKLLGDSAVSPPVPVTLLTGFLGAGKTTLLNHILSSNEHGQRVAVVENEAGKVSIDHALLKHAVGNNENRLFVFQNGCICCSRRPQTGAEMDHVLESLTALLASQPQLPFTSVVVELSGLADPSECVRAFVRHQHAASPFFLNAVVCLVDCLNAERHLDGKGWSALAREMERQLAFADLVIFNKVHGVPADKLRHLQQRVEETNPLATFQFADLKHPDEHRVDVCSVLAPRAFTPDMRVHGDAHHEPHAHSPDISHQSAEVQGFAAAERVVEWVKRTVGDNPEGVMRVKGVFRVRGRAEGFVVHAVHESISTEFVEGVDTEGCCRLVLIGRGLAPGLAEQCMAQCVVAEG